MPVDMDILEHDYVGPLIREGIAQGRREATVEILQGQIEKRFGPVPEWAEQRLADSSQSQLQDLALKFVDAKTLEELFA